MPFEFANPRMFWAPTDPSGMDAGDDPELAGRPEQLTAALPATTLKLSGRWDTGAIDLSDYIAPDTGLLFGPVDVRDYDRPIRFDDLTFTITITMDRHGYLAMWRAVTGHVHPDIRRMHSMYRRKRGRRW